MKACVPCKSPTKSRGVRESRIKVALYTLQTGLLDMAVAHCWLEEGTGLPNSLLVDHSIPERQSATSITISNTQALGASNSAPWIPSP